MCLFISNINFDDKINLTNSAFTIGFIVPSPNTKKVQN